MNRDSKYWADVVRELCKLPSETEWVEFKCSNKKPELIGEYISALSNSAALCKKSNAYLVWGIADNTHEIIGTTFDPCTTKQGNENLENWLLRLLNPRVGFSFHAVDIVDKRIVVLEIARATNKPVSFEGKEYIRVGSYKKALKEFPEKERELWRYFDQMPFERGFAIQNIQADQVLSLLDYPAYFDLLEMPLPDNRAGIFERLEADRMIAKSESGAWNITNLGGVLFAKDLTKFDRLKRKAVRVIVYKDNSRIETIREYLENKGYELRH